MQKRSDDRLVAYLDGELEPAEQREVDALLDSDPAARDQLAALALSAKLVRRAFDDVLHEPLPDRLIAAARGQQVAGATGLQAVPTRRRAGVARLPRWSVGLPIAASLLGLLVGGGATYFGVGKFIPGSRRRCPRAVGNRGGSRQQSLARQRRRLFQAVRQRRRQLAGRRSCYRRPTRGAAKDQPELAAAGAPARPQAVGPQFSRRPADRGRRTTGSPARLYDRATRRSARWP